MQLQIAAKPWVLCCHTSEELALPPFAKLL